MTSITATAFAEAFREHRDAFGVSLTYTGTAITAIVAEADLGRELMDGGFAQTGDLSCKILLADIPTGTTVGTTFSGSASTDRLTTASAHGLIVGDSVRLEAGTGALPTGLAAATDYYVQAVPTTTTLTLSATSGGALINITADGGTLHLLKSMVPAIGDAAVYNGRDFRVASVARQPGSQVAECTMRPAKR